MILKINTDNNIELLLEVYTHSHAIDLAFKMNSLHNIEIGVFIRQNDIFALSEKSKRV